ncbi:MAG TPA: peptidoglycan-binding domain-containing protein [Wenzhouxiangellaceae bacterium]|nr:peptidoglycan-binding domain-containing protein [Wenzhouxiangellaceae bacterium]
MTNLRQGSRGPEVKRLQRELNSQLFPRPNLVDDGIFGGNTRRAVLAFQRQSGIQVDGIVGPETRATLGLPNVGTPFTHRVRLYFRGLSLTNVRFSTIFSSTQMVYAQYGIQIVFGSGMSLGLSESEAKRFEQLDGSCAWKISSGEYAQLQRLGPTVPANAIIVYFIDRFSQALNGCGGHLPNRPACIVARAGTQWCAAHEVGHVLLTSNFSPVHINDTSNLMHPVDIARSATPGLTQAQVTRIKSSPLCTPI